MKFAQKLTCVMLLVITAAFSLGGSALLYSEFTDRLTSTTAPEQTRHNLACYTLEREVQTRRSRGESVADTDLVAVCRALEAGPGDQMLGLYRTAAQSDAPLFSTMPNVPLPQDGQYALARDDGGRVYRVYNSGRLLDGLVVFSAFDLTEIFVARTRSLQRFLLLEAVVLVLSAVVCTLLSRGLTRPLSALTAAAGQVAQGDYARRTALRTGDEVEDLSASFDRMAAAVQDKVDALELSVQQREDFMGAFTHELKTPMTAILGYADMLRTMQVDPADQRAAAQDIYHEARRLEDLSGKLLQLLHLAEEPLRLAPLYLDDAVDAAARAVQGVQGDCTLHTPPCCQWVLGDADLLTDLFLNLFTNAVRATQTGKETPGGNIWVQYDLLPGGTLQVAVRDDGCGIPPDKLARLTEPFYMVNKSRARSQGGSGLGLALCARIAAAHGATLQFESEEGHGTTVRFALPLAEEGKPC